MPQCLISLQTDSITTRTSKFKSLVDSWNINHTCPPNETISWILRNVKDRSSSCVIFILDASQFNNGWENLQPLLRQFAELLSFSIEANSYVQFTVESMEPDGEVLQYRCDRVSDISLVIEDEGAKSYHWSLHGSVVAPTSNTFDFLEHRLTVLFLKKDSLPESIPDILKSVSEAYGIHFSVILFHFMLIDLASNEVESFMKKCLFFKEHASPGALGTQEVFRTSRRLRDVRSWSLRINETNRCAPMETGPYFINLNPRLCIGERLAYLILLGKSHIVSEKGPSGYKDIIISGYSENLTTVVSPHCSLSRDEKKVTIKPIGGLTYINGKILAEEYILKHNDRVILGSEVILRFVEVTETQKTGEYHSRILDWEYCAKEFDEAVNTNMLSHDVKRLASSLQASQSRLKTREMGPTIMIVNPPSHYKGSFSWSLAAESTNVPLIIGSGGDINVPFLKNKAALSFRANGFDCKVGNDRLLLYHGDLFSIDEYKFRINVNDDRSKDCHSIYSIGDKQCVPLFTPSNLIKFRNAMFEFQWSLAVFYDFSTNFIRHRSDFQRFKDLFSERILSDNNISVDDINKIILEYTDIIRIIASLLAEETNKITDTKNVERLSSMSSNPKIIGFSAVRELLENNITYSKLEEQQIEIGSRLIQLRCQTEKGSMGLKNDRNLNNLPKPVSDGVSMTSMQQLKAICISPSPLITRHLTTAAEAVLHSKTPKSVLLASEEQLESIVKVCVDLKVPPERYRMLLFAFLDVIIAYEIGIQQKWLSSEEDSDIQKKAEKWIILALQCQYCIPLSRTKRDADINSMTRGLSSNLTAERRNIVSSRTLVSSQLPRGEARGESADKRFRVSSSGPTSRGGSSLKISTSSSLTAPRLNQNVRLSNLTESSRSSSRGMSRLTNTHEKTSASATGHHLASSLLKNRNRNEGNEGSTSLKKSTLSERPASRTLSKTRTVLSHAVTPSIISRRSQLAENVRSSSSRQRIETGVTPSTINSRHEREESPTSQVARRLLEVKRRNPPPPPPR